MRVTPKECLACSQRKQSKTSGAGRAKQGPGPKGRGEEPPFSSQAPTTATPCPGRALLIPHCLPYKTTGTHGGLWWTTGCLGIQQQCFHIKQSTFVSVVGSPVHKPYPIIRLILLIQTLKHIFFSCFSLYNNAFLVNPCSACKDLQGRPERGKAQVQTYKSSCFMFLSPRQLCSQKKWGTCHPMRSGSPPSPLDAARANYR